MSCVRFRLKSSLSSSSSSSSADLINSDRVTSSSDDLSHMIALSPPSAARRHRDQMRDDVADDNDAIENARNSPLSRVGRDKTRALSDSVFTHLPTRLPTPPQVSSRLGGVVVRASDL